MISAMDENDAATVGRKRSQEGVKPVLSPNLSTMKRLLNLISRESSNLMAYSHLPCRAHGRLHCPCTELQWQEQNASALPSSSGRVQGWQHASSTSEHTLSPAGRITSDSASNMMQIASHQRASFPPALRETGYEEEGSIALSFPSPIQSSAQNRVQIQQRFDDLHTGASNNARMVFNYQALDTTDPQLRATISAMDTLCIAQIATAFNDHSLMLNARVMYGTTIKYLRSRLHSIASGHPDTKVLDDIVGAVHILTACAWYNCLETDSLEWMRHTQALLKILEVYGWNSLNPSTARSFYVNWRYRAFLEGLIQRKPLPFPEPPKPTDSYGRSTSFLTDFALEIPGLLWRSEKIFHRSHTNTIARRTVLELLTEVERSIAKLKRWHLDWMKSFPLQPHYRTVSIRNFKHFNALAGDQLTVFATAYDFSHTRHEGTFRMLNISLLHLDQVIINIHQAFPDFCAGEEFKLQLRSAEYDAETCASDLCMVVPFVTLPENMTFAAIHAQRPLYYAMQFWQSQGKEPQLNWCRKVSQSLKERYGIEIKFP